MLKTLSFEEVNQKFKSKKETTSNVRKKGLVKIELKLNTHMEDSKFKAKGGMVNLHTN